MTKKNFPKPTLYGLLSVVCCLLSVSSCNTPEKLLCKTWKVIDVDFDETTVNISQSDKPLMVQQLRDSCLFVFNKDHTYFSKLPQQTETGVWNFSKNHDTLYTQNNHTGAASKINVLSPIALDIDAYVRDGTHMKFILAPVQK